jgi:hypothetical protein
MKKEELRRDFWERHPGLIWSNPNASDSIRIRAALLRPRFHILLDIAVEFGPDRLREEWQALCDDRLTDTAPARPIVERCLFNIEEGHRRAAA